jgi:probable HAF family extracellular repeat protein
MVDLGSFAGDFSEAQGINAQGQVVGLSSVDANHIRAFLDCDGVMYDLGTFAGGGSSAAFGINSASEVVGYAITALGNSHAFFWIDGLMTDLGTLGGSYSRAWNLNDAGDVIGDSGTSNGLGHAFLYRNGVMADLGALPNYPYSTAFGINEREMVVGYAATFAGYSHAFLYDQGSMKDLGDFPGYPDTWAEGINNLGQIVGWGGDRTGLTHAFIYDRGAMVDLNTLIPAGSGWILWGGNGINDAGQIAGTGMINGHVHAFLLTPVQPIACWCWAGPATWGSCPAPVDLMVNQVPPVDMEIAVQPMRQEESSTATQMTLSWYPVTDNISPESGVEQQSILPADSLE